MDTADIRVCDLNDTDLNRPTGFHRKLLSGIGSSWSLQFLRSALLRGFFGGPFLLGASSGQAVRYAVVPFVAGMLEYGARNRLQQHFCGPGSDPRRLVFALAFV